MAATKDIIEFSMAFIMLIGVIGGLLNRYLTARAIGERFTQYIVFVLAIPAIVILAFKNLIGHETTAAVLGVAVGFAASVAGRDLASGKKKDRAPTMKI
jgi:hypothetical protein